MRSKVTSVRRTTWHLPLGATSRAYLPVINYLMSFHHQPWHNDHVLIVVWFVPSLGLVSMETPYGNIYTCLGLWRATGQTIMRCTQQLPPWCGGLCLFLANWSWQCWWGAFDRCWILPGLFWPAGRTASGWKEGTGFLPIYCCKTRFPFERNQSRCSHVYFCFILIFASESIEKNVLQAAVWWSQRTWRRPACFNTRPTGTARWEEPSEPPGWCFVRKLLCEHKLVLTWAVRILSAVFRLHSCLLSVPPWSSSLLVFRLDYFRRVLRGVGVVLWSHCRGWVPCP